MKLMSPQLQAFLAITKDGTAHAAADSLNITQTAVTQRIKALEDRLSTSLFIRTRQGMTLTKEGGVLLRYCHSLEVPEGEVMSGIKNTGKENVVSLSLAGPLTLLKTRIIPACRQVVNRYPNLLLKYQIDDEEKRINSLKRGNADFVITEPRFISDEMESKTLKPEAYVLVIPAAWKNRKIKEIIQHERIIDFDESDHTTFDYLKQYHFFDMANKDRHFTNRTDTLALMIAQGFGYGVLPHDFALENNLNGQLVIVESEKCYFVPMTLAWFQRRNEPGYFSAIIESCK